MYTQAQHSGMGFDWGGVITWGLQQIPGAVGTGGDVGSALDPKFQSQVYPILHSKAQSSGIPAVAYWHGATIAVAPDGSVQVVDQYQGLPITEAFARLSDIANQSGQSFYSYEYGAWKFYGQAATGGGWFPGTTAPPGGGIDPTVPPIQAGMDLTTPLLIGAGVIAVVALTKKRR